MSAVDFLAYLLLVCAAVGAVVLSGLAFLALVGVGRGLAWLLRLAFRRPARSEVSL